LEIEKLKLENIKLQDDRNTHLKMLAVLVAILGVIFYNYLVDFVGIGVVAFLVLLMILILIDYVISTISIRLKRKGINKDKSRIISRHNTNKSFKMSMLTILFPVIIGSFITGILYYWERFNILLKSIERGRSSLSLISSKESIGDGLLILLLYLHNFSCANPSPIFQFTL
jgi:hypothetical protein